MPLTMTQYTIPPVTGSSTEPNIWHGDDALATIGAWVVNGIDIETRWNETPDGDGFTLLILRTRTGRILSASAIVQTVTHTGV